MDKRVSGILLSICNSFLKNLDGKGDYQIIINGDILNSYCAGNKCSDNLAKINAGCLYLFDAFFKNSSVFMSDAKGNTNIVEYIIIWLSYMLNLKKSEENMSNLQYFYKTYINNDMYTHTITDVTDYKDYKELIDNNIDLINMNIKDISNFYDAFYALCMMHFEFNQESPDCGKYLKNAQNFAEKYKKLNNVSDNKDSPYNRLLYTLSNDYDNFKKNCSVKCSISSFPTIEKPKNYVETFEKGSDKTVKGPEHLHAQDSEVASSSSSIANNLFIVLSIFGAIAFFLGISYKYSLFGFRKRFQKQKLREKLKNIKKRMNH
ncbi:PIR protein [Plasmodium yoelii]|uniref:PIR protein n=2 Tax=Plasmodium yoelii TaxID=5861 RepID=A0AAE9WX10_PLAYO|nr:PIR protein [Plasmodium yoelii]WBY60546.1 PIR protein [Plasmodium yoelii yoelii]CDU20362.1 YIR protein [Plasmodium yoelii]VTZ81322.1 PIR protein [Plasmodium yoelii]|eukprot:XP_022812782.1 PIR protein [Plasmodium yoelii]